jgi:hypothetical protein
MTLGSFKNFGFEVQGSVALSPEVFDEHQITADLVNLTVQNQPLIRCKRKPKRHCARNCDERCNLAVGEVQKRQLLPASLVDFGSVRALLGTLQETERNVR